MIMEEEIPGKKEGQTPEEESSSPPKTRYKGRGIRISTSYGKTSSGFWGFPVEREHISVEYRRKRK